LSHSPATVADVITIDKPRSPEAQFEETYQRRRRAVLEFLAHRRAETA
jgi:NitT/TauT family transport system ATP-binding protein